MIRLWDEVAPTLTVLLLAAPASAHDFYGELHNGAGLPCCHGDCHPMEPGTLRLNDDGSWSVEIEGAWSVVDEKNVLRDQAPDGRPHLCPAWTVPKTARCLILPRGM